ncbi:MAG: cation transporter [Candidatus Omnitrophica bacterium]|nr:cation transporter [Candidatus Omnitrophota bacterium]
MAVKCEKCYWCAEQVGAINLWANIGLFIVKFAGGIVGGSQALLADALHSISDIVIAALLMVGLKITGAPPDEDHRWGHGHIEYIVSAIIGILLVFAAIIITVAAMVSMYEGYIAQPGILAIWAAVISIIANEIMFRHSLCIGEQMKSPAMIANAWENRADVYTSFAALIGIIGARMGIKILDPIAAIVVGLMIARTGLVIASGAVNGITDRTVDNKFLVRIRKILNSEEAIIKIVKLHARTLGQKNWVDIEAEFSEDLKVSEVKKVIKKLDKLIKDNIEGIADVRILSRASAKT